MLNFVIVLGDEDGKLQAFAQKIPENQNLAHLCNWYEQYGTQTVAVLHYCKSYKRACEIANAWNESYKANGTYKEFN